MRRSLGGVLLAFVLAFGTGCSDDEESKNTNATGGTGGGGGSGGTGGSGGSTDAGNDAATTAKIVGTATYNGSLDVTTLNLALVDSFPPTKPPTAVKLNITGTWPATAFEMDNLPAGKWIFFGYAAVGSPHPLPAATDPSYMANVDLVAGQTLTHDFTLMDPPPPDAGGDASDGSAGDGSAGGANDSGSD